MVNMMAAAGGTIGTLMSVYSVYALAGNGKKIEG